MKEETSKNKMVVLDWGGIIESTSSHNDWQIAMVHALSDEKYENNYILDAWRECKHAEFGKDKNITNDDNDVFAWFERLKKKFNFSCDYKKFLETYTALGIKTHYYRDVVEYIYELKKSCKIAILSNTGKLDYPRLNYQCDLSKFDYVWLSYELGCKKPNNKIFNIVEEQSGIFPINIMFIDDRQSNIETASLSIIDVKSQHK